MDMEKIIEIALEECANLSIAEAQQIYKEIGCSDVEEIRKAVLKIKFKL